MSRKRGVITHGVVDTGLWGSVKVPRGETAKLLALWLLCLTNYLLFHTAHSWWLCANLHWSFTGSPHSTLEGVTTLKINTVTEPQSLILNLEDPFFPIPIWFPSPCSSGLSSGVKILLGCLLVLLILFSENMHTLSSFLYHQAPQDSSVPLPKPQHPAWKLCDLHLLHCTANCLILERGLSDY